LIIHSVPNKIGNRNEQSSSETWLSTTNKSGRKSKTKMTIQPGFAMPNFTRVHRNARVGARAALAEIIANVIKAHGMGMNMAEALEKFQVIEPLLYKGNFEAAYKLVVEASLCILDEQNQTSDGETAMFAETIINQCGEWLDKAEADIHYAQNYWARQLADNKDYIDAKRQEVLSNPEWAAEEAARINAENVLRRELNKMNGKVATKAA
jgi:hypothetical protein